MTATDGAWDAPVVNAIPDETLRYAALTVTDARDLFVIHSALLHTGKVLWFSGHAETMYYATVSFVFDPDTGNLSRVPFPAGMDLFCCHFVQLPDGRLLTVGGSDPDFVGHSSRGAKNIVIFDPTPTAGFPDGHWIDTGQQLIQGRWYPTAVLLGDGRVLVFSGRLEYGTAHGTADIANLVEVLAAPNFVPQALTGVDFELPLYPGLHLAPDGRIYYSHTNWGQQIPEPTSRALTVTGNAGAWTALGVEPSRPRREEGMSVLLPPAQDGKILVVGGSEAQNSSDIPVLQAGGGGPSAVDHIADPADARSAEILTTGSAPSWAPAPGGGATAHGRINGHLVLLPDATVLVCGGHNHYKWLPDPPTTPSRVAEIFTPGTGFRPVASMVHPRMYHSTALLLPDGRVVVAGGADGNDDEEELPWPAGWPSDLRWTLGTRQLNRKEREIYRPPYFFKGPRPTITDVTRNGASTRQVPYGSTFVITTPQAADITAVALMRPGAATHHTDSEQRYVPLTFPPAVGNELTVTMLPAAQASTAPPGYYMLWIIDNQQRPCERALFVQVLSGPASSGGGTGGTPSGGGGSLCPCLVLTLLAGAAPAGMIAAEVVALRRLRFELATGTAAGGRFIAMVNRAYYSVSPQLAGWLTRHERVRVAARRVLVRPAAAAVRGIERAAAPIPWLRARHAVLMALLTLLALATAVTAPALLLAIAAAAALQRPPRDGQPPDGQPPAGPPGRRPSRSAPSRSAAGRPPRPHTPAPAGP